MAVLMDDLRSLAKTAIEALDDESLLANRDLALRVEATDQTEMLTLWQVKALIDAEIRKRGL